MRSLVHVFPLPGAVANAIYSTPDLGLRNDTLYSPHCGSPSHGYL